MLRQKFDAMRTDLSNALVERDAEIELVLCAAVTKRPLFLAGDPGTAKSLLATYFTEFISGGVVFRYLMSKTTKPDEIYGPIGLKDYKEDRYKRVTTGRLPEAHVAFLDEIFKANSAINNSLLTIINEGKFNNGDHGELIKVPLQLLIAASNEYPGSGDNGQEELSAMYDRFLFRKNVRPVTSVKGRKELIWGNLEFKPSVTVTPEEINEAHTEAMSIPWTDEATDAMLEIIAELHQEGITPGNRRERQSNQAVKATAWLNGHDAVLKDDLAILADTLWIDHEEQPKKTAKIVQRIANPSSMKVTSLLMQADEIINGVNIRELASCATASSKLSAIYKDLSSVDSARGKESAEYVKSEIKRIKTAAAESFSV